MSRAVRRDYDRRADSYDRRWGWYLDATIRETLARMEVGPGERVLDVGCGTGRLLESLSLAHPPDLLAGADLSGGMLGVARDRLPPGVALVQADAPALPFRGGAFHQVVSSSAFHFWPRPLDGLREMARVLTPGGRLVLSDWSRDFWGPKLRELYLRAVDPAHVRTYLRDEVEGMLREAGFRVLGGDLYRIRPSWGMMTLRAERPPSA